jgi:uncharacterized protein YndB with AHSA1/START domain
MKRTFDAPRELVFAAYTKPELLQRWFGVFRGHIMTLCEVDLRVGGAYHYVWRLANGSDMGMSGVFREIVVPERIVCTEKFDDPWYQGEAVDTVTFEERGGQTTLTIAALADSREARDAMLESGMSDGVIASYDQLDEVLESMRAELKS